MPLRDLNTSIHLLRLYLELYLHSWQSTCLSHQASALCYWPVCPEMVTQLRCHFLSSQRAYHHYMLPIASHLDLHSLGENPLSPQGFESPSSHSPIVSTFSAFLLQIKVLLVSLHPCPKPPSQLAQGAPGKTNMGPRWA